MFELNVSSFIILHQFVSIAKNLSEGQVKKLVGHSKSMDTFSVYGHEVNGEMEKTAHDIQGLFDDILNIETDETV